MATNPLQAWPGGPLPTSTLNNPISYLNTLFAGLDQVQTVVASADLTPLTTSYQDIPSLVTSVTVTGSNAIGVVIGTAGWGCSVAGAGNYLDAVLVVDGVVQNGNILSNTDSTFSFRTSSRAWSMALAAGTRTIKMQGRKSAVTPTGKAIAGHSAFTLILFDLP